MYFARGTQLGGFMEETNSTTTAQAGANGGTVSSGRSTTVSTTTETQTIQEPVNDVQPENQTTEQTDIEPEKADVDVTEDVEAGQKVTNWEKIAKDNQASFTKISQEKAELTKRIEELESKLKPKVIQDGKIKLFKFSI